MSSNKNRPDLLERLLQPFSELSYALLRVLSGLLFAFHGAQKVFGLLRESALSPSEQPQLFAGGVIELVTGVLMAVGFKTRWSAFLASGTMAVAYIQFHWKWQMDKNFLPTINHGELALVYCFLFLYMACKGTGRMGIERA